MDSNLEKRQDGMEEVIRLRSRMGGYARQINTENEEEETAIERSKE